MNRAITALLLVSACGGRAATSGTPAAAPLDLVDAFHLERASYERARPVLERHCSSCHTRAGVSATPEALRRFSMDAYPFGGGDRVVEVATTILDALGATGEAATMPPNQPGGVRDDELAAVANWADAAYKANASEPRSRVSGHETQDADHSPAHMGGGLGCH